MSAGLAFSEPISAAAFWATTWSRLGRRPRIHGGTDRAHHAGGARDAAAPDPDLPAVLPAAAVSAVGRGVHGRGYGAHCAIGSGGADGGVAGTQSGDCDARGGADEPRARDHSTQRRRFMTPITFRTRVNVGTLTIFACFVVFWLSQLFGAWTLMSVFPLTMAVMFSYLGWALSGEVSLSVTDADLHIVGSRPGQQRLTVPITQITTIRNAPRPIWTFALRRSPKIQKFPQLEIRYKTVSNVVVAPTDPEAFVAALLARNPAIALEAGKRVPGVAGLRN